MDTLSPELMLAATNVRPLPDPAQRRISLQAAMQERQLRDQQMQQNALALARAKRDADDEQAYREVVMGSVNPGALQQTAPPQAAPQAAPQQQAPPQQAPTQMSGTPSPAPAADVPMAPGTNVPLTSFDTGRAIQELRRRGLVKQADALAASQIDHQFKMAEASRNQAQADKDVSETQKAALAAVYETTTSLMGMADTASRAAAWPVARQQLIEAGHIKPSDAPAQYPGDRWIGIHHDLATTQVARIAKAEEDRKAGLAPSQLEEAQNKARQEAANANQAQRADAATQLTAALKQGPDAFTATLNQLPHGIAKDFAGAKTEADILRIGQKPEETIQSDQAAANAKETKREHDATISQGNQRLGIERADLALKQQTFKLAQDAAARTGVGGVAPHLIAPASAQFEKAGIKYAQASSTDEAFQSILNLAQNGNKAAGANLPLVGVETVNAINGIKRINSAEIAQYGTKAGSLWDKVQGELGSITQGKPFSQSLLNDIRALHVEIGKQARTTYEREVQITNNTYGSQFKPVSFGAASGGASSAVPPAVSQVLSKAGPGIHTLSDGSKWMTAADGTITRQ